MSEPTSIHDVRSVGYIVTAWLTALYTAGGVMVATFGALGGFAYDMTVRNAHAQAIAPQETVMVIVAARSLSAGTTIAEEHLYAVEISTRFVPPGVFLDPSHVIGRQVFDDVFANEFIHASRLYP